MMFNGLFYVLCGYMSCLVTSGTLMEISACTLSCFLSLGNVFIPNKSNQKNILFFFRFRIWLIAFHSRSACSALRGTSEVSSSRLLVLIQSHTAQTNGELLWFASCPWRGWFWQAQTHTNQHTSLNKRFFEAVFEMCLINLNNKS